MKNLNNFLTEKKKANSKTRPAKKKEGKDDKKYFELIGKYKQMRKNSSKRKEANAILKEAMELARDGNVSAKCKLGAAYL